MTAHDAPPQMWMTSGEHAGWHLPRLVQVDETGTGPNPDRAYALLTVLSERPEGGAARLVVADRFAPGWRLPDAGHPREVAVWRLDRPGVTWADQHLATESPSPEAWCTVCATEAEADQIADAMERDLQRAGW